jgi:hypothetical protein
MYRNQIQFAPFSSLEMQKEAHIHVVSKNLYSQDAARTPAPFGVLDPKLVIKFCFFFDFRNHCFSLGCLWW